MDPADPPDVVEDDVVVRTFGDHSACLKHSVDRGRVDEIGQLALGREDHHRRGVMCHCADSISFELTSSKAADCSFFDRSLARWHDAGRT